MTIPTLIRDSLPGDRPALEALYPAAFTEEDLLPLLNRLLPDDALALSLVAVIDGALAGHVAFTRCTIRPESQNPASEGADDATPETPAALLAPLAVAPAHQRQGVGSALVRAGLERLATAGIDLILVLGDPGYYARFGFTAEDQIAPPYPLPPAWAGAWQSLNAQGPAMSGPGQLVVPAPWRDRALWSD